jgi:hypothetical protein
MPKISDMISQEVSNTAWSFAKLQLKNQPLLAAISGEALRPICDDRDFDPQFCAGIPWAFATLGCFDPTLFAAISSASIAMIGAYRTQELSNIAWSLATLVLENGPLL